jgi:hypothetical protein
LFRTTILSWRLGWSSPSSPAFTPEATAAPERAPRRLSS